jgi:hypothetical protein
MRVEHGCGNVNHGYGNVEHGYVEAGYARLADGAREFSEAGAEVVQWHGVDADPFAVFG